MTQAFALVVPVLFLVSFLFAAIRKVKIYDSFTEGVKGAIPLIVSIFPYIATVTMLCKLLEASGLDAAIAEWLFPVFRFFGIPEEISALILIKPLSGNGSVAVLTEILERHGIDSYISRCACVMYGCSDTIFYIGAVYFAGLKRKKMTAAFCIALISYLLSIVFCCFICRFL